MGHISDCKHQFLDMYPKGAALQCVISIFTKYPPEFQICTYLIGKSHGFRNTDMSSLQCNVRAHCSRNTTCIWKPSKGQKLWRGERSEEEKWNQNSPQSHPQFVHFQSPSPEMFSSKRSRRRRRTKDKRRRQWHHLGV